MAKLVIYVPFARNGRDVDLRRNANEIPNAHTYPDTRCKKKINDVVVVYLNEENRANARLRTGDVFVVHAHGGDDTSTLFDNRGESILIDTLIAKLSTLNAFVVKEAYFFACYSALPNHIGPVFKKRVSNCKVFGVYELAEGSLALITRHGTCRTAVWSSEQLSVIELNQRRKRKLSDR